MPDRVNQERAYQSATRYSDRQNAWFEHNVVLKKQIKDSTELYKKHTEDQDDLNEMIFNLAYQPGKGG